MNTSNKETIAAIATPSGRGGVGIVRVSGHLVKTIAYKILGFEPKIRHAHYADFFDSDHKLIDQGIALLFQGPNSFTGEDVLELQGHGGPIVLDQLLKSVLHYGARLAKPGEFSEQAFLNNKLDLTQAEAIADLINAESEQAARCAMRSLQGEFSKKIHMIVDQLIQLRMYVEAAIDFPEEEIDFLSQSNVLKDAKHILSCLEILLAQAHQGALISEGITVVIAGAPNVGKSSLLNFLSGRDSAIVTDIAGTTRDILREKIILDGMPIHVIDTAGLRDTDDVVEQEGIRRAKSAMQTADLVLYLLDMDQAKNMDLELQELKNHVSLNIPSLIVVNKIDLFEELSTGFHDLSFGVSVKDFKELEEKISIFLNLSNNQISTTHRENTVTYVSIKKNIGMNDFIKKLKQKVGYQTATEGNFIARRRHIDALQRAQECINNGIAQMEQYRAAELLAEEFRLAQDALSSITGQFTSDDLLGEIFSSFCIGK